MALHRFVEDLGVQVIGGCCGTRPEHIAALAEISQELAPKRREIRVSPYLSGSGSATAPTDNGEDKIVRPALNYTPAAASIYGAQP